MSNGYSLFATNCFLSFLSSTILFTSCILLHHKPVHIPLLLAEVHAHLYQAFPVQRIGNEVAFLIYLLQGILGCAVQLELEHINDVFRLHHGIGTTAGTAHFHLHELPHQGKHHIEDGLVVALGIVAQLVGHTCEEHFQAFHEGRHITRTKLAYETGNMKSGLVIGDLRVERHQEVQEPVTDLVVGKLKRIEPEFLVVALDGEIATLVNHGQRVVGLRTVFRKGGRGHFHPVHQQAQVVVALLEQIHQVSGRARLEPEVIQYFRLAGIQHAERIEDAGAIRVKVIAVVQAGHPLQGGFKIHSVGLPQQRYLRGKRIYQFLFRNAAQGGVFGPGADVLQLVQVAEHADLRKLGDTRQEDEAKVAVGTFQHTVEGFQGAAVLLQQLFVEDGLEQGLVVFVNQDHDSLAGLFVSTPDDAFKTGRERSLRRILAVTFFPKREVAGKHLLQRLLIGVFFGIQVEVQHGILLPFRLQFLDGQPFEQLLPSLEVGFEGGNEQALAEAARAAQEIGSRGRGDLINQRRLIHVHIALLPDFPKGLYADRQFPKLFHIFLFYR